MHFFSYLITCVNFSVDTRIWMLRPKLLPRVVRQKPANAVPEELAEEPIRRAMGRRFVHHMQFSLKLANVNLQSFIPSRHFFFF